MSIQSRNISTLNDLFVWRESHELALAIYQVTTAFQSEETLPLAGKLRRVAKGITVHMGDGLGKSTKREKLQAYFLAQGSLMALERELIQVKELGHLTRDRLVSLRARTRHAGQLLGRLISSVKGRKQR